MIFIHDTNAGPDTATAEFTVCCNRCRRPGGAGPTQLVALVLALATKWTLNWRTMRLLCPHCHAQEKAGAVE
jgi:hypothetical protein